MAKTVWMVMALCLAVAGSSAAAETPAERTQKLIKKLGTEKNPALRKEALEELAAVGTPEAIAAVAGILKDPNDWLRVSATVELVKLGEQARTAVPAVKEALADGDPLVRYNGALFLYKLKAATSAELAPPLAAALPTAPAKTAEHMLKFLISMGLEDKDVRAAVLPILTSGPVELKRQVVGAIDGSRLAPAQPWAAEVVAALVAATHDPDQAVRVGSVEKLGTVNPHTPAVTAALMAALDDTDVKVATAAAGGMVGRSDVQAGETAMKHLAGRLKSSPAAEDRARAAAAMARLLSARDTGAPALIQALGSDKDPSVRKQAIVTLRELRADQGIDAMLQALKSDADVKVRVAAADALSSYSTDALDRAGKRAAVLAGLRAAQSDASDSVRTFAQAGIEKLQ